jgi:hypothetical protein
MRPKFSPLVPFLIASLYACNAVQDERSDVQPRLELAHAEEIDPMASFARLVGGEWWVTFTSGERAVATWGWGPGTPDESRSAC